jgi:integrase
VQAVTSNPYEEFLRVGKAKAPRTLQNYEEAIRLYMRDMALPNYEALTNAHHIAIEDTMKAYFAKVSRPRADVCMKALRLFYQANRMAAVIEWDHVRHFKPVRPDVAPDDRPYTKDEIKTLAIAAPNARVKLAIMTMASGGLRVGALPGLTIKDLTWIESQKLFAVMVYAGTKGQYMTFLTPQTSAWMAKVVRGKPANMPVFYNIFVPDLPATKSAHVVSIWRVVKRVGLWANPSMEGRAEAHLDHGFRKAFRTALDAGKLREDMAERLTGHGKKLVKTYSRPDAEQWLQDSGYLATVPHLTF